ncbi:hypothetical protein NKR23_g906 [Pleurostoma richardsiae]|uniref:Uncharacterized protein n=1 Tax=Pleurostoma richardsiae TaxID=41990 RepID=A0AA38RT67_9PEZI|nr:hypothetical protein NKR23_g906 [Pleurostoma richardsiae]
MDPTANLGGYRDAAVNARVQPERHPFTYPDRSSGPDASPFGERGRAPIAEMNTGYFKPIPSPALSGTPPCEINQDHKEPPNPAVTHNGEERWTPRGRFQDKTWAELLEELPFGPGVWGLIFTVEGPGMSTREPIPRDDEDGLDSMKRYVNRAIRDWFTRQMKLGGRGSATPRLVLDILIEKMTDENGDGGDEFDDLQLDCTLIVTRRMV